MDNHSVEMVAEHGQCTHQSCRLWCTILCLLLQLNLGCSSSDRNAQKAQFPDQAAQESASSEEPFNTEVSAESQSASTQVAGKVLAEQYCKRCHPTPLPEQLPADRWPYVLQWMGHYFGHESFEGPRRSVVLDELVPESPSVDSKTLEAIQEYYVSNAPEEPTPDEVFDSALRDSALFRERPSSFLPSPRLISCLKFDPAHQILYVGDGQANRLWLFSQLGVPLGSYECRDTQPIDVVMREERIVVPLIGDFMRGEDLGGVMMANRDNQTEPVYPVKDFYRTAHTTVADLDGDGREDLVVSGFGARKAGALSVFWNEGNGYERQDLLNRNGSLRTAAQDVDGDGDLDLLLMTAQGYHEFSWFRNDGQRSFLQQGIWLKHSSLGTNGFRLADLNRDGSPELIVYCGNNMELANPPVRPYHGIYVYRGNPLEGYEQVYFHPLPGAIACEIADFNGDQKLDIAAVSSLPDWRVEKPISTLMMLQSEDLQFESTTIAETRGTQWTSMTSADIDQDGDIDLVLGMLHIVPDIPAESLKNFRSATAKQPAVMVLENQSVNN